VALVGFGLVGKELYRQLQERQAYFYHHLRAEVRLVAVANSRRAAALRCTPAFDEAGMVASWRSLLPHGDGKDGRVGPFRTARGRWDERGWREKLERPAAGRRADELALLARGFLGFHGGEILPPSRFGELGAIARAHALSAVYEAQCEYKESAAADPPAAVAVVVDATASDATAALYPRWIAAGAHVVTANKRMGSGPLSRLDALLKRLAPAADGGRARGRVPAGEERDADALKKVRDQFWSGWLSPHPLPPDLCAEAIPRPPRFLYEATVGAGLPILSTLRSLVETGDKIKSIEGVLSGTLSYIFSTYKAGGQPFSVVVSEAKEKGYTEPDPRDDLSGMDVARKAVILAREVGVRIELSDVGAPGGADGGGGGTSAGRGGRGGGRGRGRGGRGGRGAAAAAAAASSSSASLLLVPPSLSQESGASVEQFMQGLPSALDAAMAQRASAAASNGCVLRYAARIDVESKTAVAGVQEFPLGHPFAALQGTDNVVRFVTERYPNGLVVQGPGAGAAVTAAGVVADIVAVARSAGRVPN
jgi:aspartokinase/homoserine dehydrogenase 1